MQMLKKPSPCSDRSSGSIKEEAIVPVRPQVRTVSPQPTRLVCDIVEIDDDGYPVINYEEQTLRADSLVNIQADYIGRRCLAMMPENNQGTPIVLGLLWQPGQTPDDNFNKVIESTESLSLNCGDSSLTLEANGTVRLQGVTVTTQAYGSNRIKGAAVKIN